MLTILVATCWVNGGFARKGSLSDDPRLSGGMQMIHFADRDHDDDDDDDDELMRYVQDADGALMRYVQDCADESRA